MTDEATVLDEEDVLRALIIDALENEDTFNAASVKNALEAIDMTAYWTEASDDNRYGDDQVYPKALNAVCVSARFEAGFDSDMFLTVLDDEGLEEMVEQMARGDEEDADEEDADDDDDVDSDEDEEEDGDEDEEEDGDEDEEEDGDEDEEEESEEEDG